MKTIFKRVPALDKCFSILEYLTEKKGSSSISELSTKLDLNKSTVFNIVHTLTDIGVLENSSNQFRFGPKLYVFGKAAEKGSDLIRTIHPFLKEISKKTSLSAFLGIRSGHRAVIIDKADSSFDLKLSSEIGSRIPLLAGAHGRALLSLLPNEEIDKILRENELSQFTPFSCVDKEKYRAMVCDVKEKGIAVDREEYIEGVRALAIPLNINRDGLQIAIWAVGLKNQLKDESISIYSNLLREIAHKIEIQF